MASRSRRSKAQKKQPSNSLWLGYVEDEESIDAIEKKFQRMEEILKEQQTSSSTPAPADVASSDDANKKEPVLSDNQLDILFRETSSFSVRQITDEKNQGIPFDELDEIETIGEIEAYFSGGEDAEDFMSDGGEDWEDFDDDERPKTKGKRKQASGLSEHRVLEITTQDGFVYSLKKRAKILDPNLPTYTKIPSEPLTLSWARPILPFSPTPIEEVPGSQYFEDNLLDFSLKSLRNNTIQAILMDPPWKLGDSSDSHIRPKQLEGLDINAVIPKVGFVFMWVEKELIPEAVKVMTKWNFIYVENLVWVKQETNNAIARQPSTYFCKSKTTLLIFKKGNGLELRHQRNPDVVFDFVRTDKSLTEDKPDQIYRVIETLLPTAKYTEEDEKSGVAPKFMELWSMKGKKRRGWISIAQN